MITDVNDLISQLRAQREAQAQRDKAFVRWCLSLLMVCMKTINEAAKEGNPTCKLAIQQIEELWKSKP